MSETPPTTVFDDPEIEAMRIIIETLEPFDNTVQTRILRYVAERRRSERMKRTQEEIVEA